MKVDIDKDELIAILQVLKPKETVTDKIRNLIMFRNTNEERQVEQELQLIDGIIERLKAIGEIP